MTLIRTYFKNDEIKARAELRKRHRRERGKDLTPKERKEIRRKVFIRDKGICQRCRKFAPLYDKYGKFKLWKCGHAAHKKNESTGGRYEIDNLEWTCAKCHLIIEHGPQWGR